VSSRDHSIQRIQYRSSEVQFYTVYASGTQLTLY